MIMTTGMIMRTAMATAAMGMVTIIIPSLPTSASGSASAPF